MPAKKRTSSKSPFYVARKRRNLTQAEAAQKMGISTASWCNWENGERKPSSLAKKLLEYVFPEIAK